MPERRGLNRVVRIERLNITREGNCKAYVSLVVADTFIIRSVKVIEGTNGLIVCMPREKYHNKAGEEKSTERAFPASLALRKQITELVLGEYHKRLERVPAG